MKVRTLISSLTLLTLVFVTSSAEACPTCKQALAGQANYGDLPRAYMMSILFMMSMPFLLLGSFGAYFYWQIKRARQEQTAAESSAIPSQAFSNRESGSTASASETRETLSV